MTPEQIKAVRKLWDAMSEYLETPGNSYPRGRKAIELMVKAFPENHPVNLDTEPDEGCTCRTLHVFPCALDKHNLKTPETT